MSISADKLQRSGLCVLRTFLFCHLCRWFELPDNDIPFHISQYPIERTQYDINDMSGFEVLIGTDELVPVKLDASRRPVRSVTDGVLVPREVTLSIGYHQYTNTQRRVLSATLTLDKFEVVSNAEGE